MSIQRIELTNWRLKAKLAEQPETSMGAQAVWITLKNGSILEGLVINGTYLESSPIEEKNIADLTVKTTEVGKSMKPTGEFRIA